MLGIEASISQCFARTLPFDANTVSRIKAEHIVFETKVEGAEESPIFFAFPHGFMSSAVFQALMIPDVANRELSLEDDSQRGAVQELFNLFCGSATRALIEIGYDSMRVSQSVEDIQLQPSGAPIEDIGTSESLVCIQLGVTYASVSNLAWCLIPEGLVKLWQP